VWHKLLWRNLPWRKVRRRTSRWRKPRWREFVRPKAGRGKDEVLVAAFAVVIVGLVVWQAIEFVAFFDEPRRAFYIVAALAILADWQPLRIGRGTFIPGYVFPSICFTFGLLLVFGTAPALIVAFLASLVATARLRLSFADAVPIIGRMLVAVTVAGLVLHALGPSPLHFGERINVGALPFVVAPAAAWFATHYLLLILTSRLRAGFSWRDVLARTFGYELLATAALLFLAPVFVTLPRGFVYALILVPVFALSQVAALLYRQSSGLVLDPVTGSLNVRGVLAEYERLAHRRTDGAGTRSVGLCVVEIQQAAEVRQVFGLGMGNQLLIRARERVASAIDEDGVVGRIFGDELVVLTAGEQAISVAHRISRAMAAPEMIEDLPFQLNGPIGVSISATDVADLAGLVRTADEAARSARRNGKPVEVYEPRVSRDTQEGIDLLRDLGQALAEPERRHEITMAYQPQVTVATGDCIGFEALLRWASPAGMVDPERLLKVVEPTALMHTLTERVIENVVTQLTEWSRLDLHPRVAINVSVRDLVNTSLVDRVCRVVDAAGLSPRQLELEITEGALVSDQARISQAVADLAGAGIAVSVDDFGTGYASLLYLRSLALNEVKIDRGLVQRITVDPNERTIVRTIVEMGQALSLRVVAEGVEDEATHAALVDLRCPAAQGFYYARPLEAVDVPAWIAAWKR
jgi:diguanylate cyclase (GGDEF)-like protein